MSIGVLYVFYKGIIYGRYIFGIDAAAKPLRQFERKERGGTEKNWMEVTQKKRRRQTFDKNTTRETKATTTNPVNTCSTVLPSGRDDALLIKRFPSNVRMSTRKRQTPATTFERKQKQNTQQAWISTFYQSDNMERCGYISLP